MLPKMLLLHTASFLDAQAVARFGSTCTRVRDDIYTNEIVWRELCRRLLSKETQSTLAPMLAGNTTAQHFFVCLAAVAGTRPMHPLPKAGAIRYIGITSHNVIDPIFIQRDGWTHPLREESESWCLFNLHETSILEWTRVDRYLGESGMDHDRSNALCREELLTDNDAQLILNLPGDGTSHVNVEMLQEELVDFGVDSSNLNLRAFLFHDLGDYFEWEEDQVEELLLGEEELQEDLGAGTGKRRRLE